MNASTTNEIVTILRKLNRQLAVARLAVEVDTTDHYDVAVMLTDLNDDFTDAIDQLETLGNIETLLNDD